jgi:hypothetical protein
MDRLFRDPFTHRPLPDGTTASFCNECFVTVATARWEAELERAERAHVCDRSLLDYWQSLIDEIRSRGADPD